MLKLIAAVFFFIFLFFILTLFIRKLKKSYLIEHFLFIKCTIKYIKKKKKKKKKNKNEEQTLESRNSR